MNDDQPTFCGVPVEWIPDLNNDPRRYYLDENGILVVLEVSPDSKLEVCKANEFTAKPNTIHLTATTAIKLKKLD